MTRRIGGGPLLPSIGPGVHIEIKPEVTPGAHPMLNFATLRHALLEPDLVRALADRMFVGFRLVSLGGMMVVMARYVGVWFLDSLRCSSAPRVPSLVTAKLCAFDDN